MTEKEELGRLREENQLLREQLRIPKNAPLLKIAEGAIETTEEGFGKIVGFPTYPITGRTQIYLKHDGWAIYSEHKLKVTPCDVCGFGYEEGRHLCPKVEELRKENDKLRAELEHEIFLERGRVENAKRRLGEGQD